MPLIQSPEDIDQSRELFSDIWKSATLRISVIETDDGVRIPNGELVFSHASREEQSTVQYEEGLFTIHEIISTSPFDLLEDIVGGRIPTANATIEIETELYSHNVGGFFQAGIDESRVKEDRPQTEYNAVIDIELTQEEGESFSETKEAIDDRLKRAQEPYYDTGRCEDYYFEYLFARRKDDPKILLFADPQIEFGISDDELELVLPSSLQSEVSLSALPQQPYGEHKGWQINLTNEKLNECDDGRLALRKELDLEGIENVYVIMYLAEEMFDLIDYTPSGAQRENPRFQILDEYDEKDHLIEYLEAPPSTDVFEVAVLNVLSTAGYFVQWFGGNSFDIPNWTSEVPQPKDREFDVIAYSPDGAQILFIECTIGEISAKEGILERSEAVATAALEEELISAGPGLIQTRREIPCIAVPQSEESLNDTVREDLENNGIEILYRERLKTIYAASQGTQETVSVDSKFIDGTFY